MQRHSTGLALSAVLSSDCFPHSLFFIHFCCRVQPGWGLFFCRMLPCRGLGLPGACVLPCSRIAPLQNLSVCNFSIQLPQEPSLRAPALLDGQTERLRQDRAAGAEEAG